MLMDVMPGTWLASPGIFYALCDPSADGRSQEREFGGYNHAIALPSRPSPALCTYLASEHTLERRDADAK